MKLLNVNSVIVALVTVLMLAVGGKDLRLLVVTPTPQMHCESCENKIKNNLRFERGVVRIETSLEEQTVSVTYDARKTNAEHLKAAFAKIGYEAHVVSDTKVPQAKAKSRK